MNNVTIIGNLTRDPEFRNTPDGICVCSFTVAVNRRFSKNNEADYLPVTAWRALAENCSKYLKKGSKVGIIGSIRIRSYEKDGENRYATEIVADEVDFLTPKKAKEATDSKDGFEPAESDELPF